MKICPNCGAENQDSALTCVLCEFEFDIDDNTITAADVAEISDTATDRRTDFNVTQAITDSKKMNISALSSGTSDFVPAASSKSFMKIIIPIASVLILGGGIAGGVFLMNNKKPELAAAPDTQATSTQETTAEQLASEETITTVETRVEMSSSAAETVQTTNDAENTDKTATDQNAVKNAYIKKLTEFTKSNEFNAYDHISKYALYDIDNDGVEELFIRYETVIGNAEKLYYYKDGEYSEITSCSESSFMVCPEAHCVQSYGYGGYTVRRIFTITGQGNTLDEAYFELSTNTYIKNNIGISKSDYDQFMAKYDSLNWINPSYNTFDKILPGDVVYAKPREYGYFSGIITTETDDLNVRELPSTDAKVIGSVPKGDYVNAYKLDGYPDWYKIQYSEKNLTGYASAKYITDSQTYNKNKAESDRKKAEYEDKSGMTATGKVTISSGVLNLRESPSTTAKVLTTIPKDHYVGIYFQDGDWYYVKYYADTDSPIYYGYVSTEYVDIYQYY